MYVVTKEIPFQTLDNNVINFNVGDMIDYHRLSDCLQIICRHNVFSGHNFDIESYVELICDNSREAKTGEEYHIQIERCDCVASANRFLNTIPGEDYVITVPLENNQYLIIYKKRG